MSQSSESLTEARVNVPMTARMYEQLRHASVAQRRSMAGLLRDAFELQEDVAELLRLCDFTMERAAVAMATTTDSKWHDYVNRDMRRIEEMRSLVAEMLTRLPARTNYHQTPCHRCGRPVDSPDPIDDGYEYYCAPCVVAHDLGDDE